MGALASIAPFLSACAALEVQSHLGRSSVASAFASSPLKLLTPQARGLSVWAVTSSFGGGLVAGDQTRLEVRLGPQARCFLGTQASTKVYRNPDARPCGHQTRATLGAGSLLVFAPDPIQPFAQSSYAQHQSFHMAHDASLVLVDWLTSGRAARGERWAFTQYASRNEVYLSRASADVVAGEGNTPPAVATPDPQSAAEELVYLDALRFDAGEDDFASRHRTGRFNCFATLLMLGPLVSAIAGRLLQETSMQPVQRGAACLASASPWRDGVVWRAAGEDVEVVGRHLRRHLSDLGPLLGDEPWLRRW